MKHVHKENGKWYFWDETAADRYGPYPNEETAISNLIRYSDWLKTGEMSKLFVEEVVEECHHHRLTQHCYECDK